ncbi:DNA ligase 1-like isoform X6 [Dysidea avara]|uniref:DNA ligase 1-like isoform X6 n=1 Tax=Dysidea avara TaxID=196820 RepID=UPI003324D68C
MCTEMETVTKSSRRGEAGAMGSDQHCLVDFEEEDCVGVVPKSSVLNNKDLTVGVKRTVKCNGGKYKAIILAIGSKSEMQQKEKEITESDEEEELNLDEETSSGPGSVKRKQCQSGKSKQSKKLKEGKAKTKKGKENEKLIKNDGAKKKQRKLKDKNSSFSMELGSPPRDSKAAHDSTSPLWEKDFHEEIYEQYSQIRTSLSSINSTVNKIELQIKDRIIGSTTSTETVLQATCKADHKMTPFPTTPSSGLPFTPRQEHQRELTQLGEKERGIDGKRKI